MVTDHVSCVTLQNGAVVNLSSLSAIQVNPDSAAYNISKAAQDHLTKTLARKYTKLGVRINSVNPGFVSAPAPMLLFPAQTGDAWSAFYERPASSCSGFFLSSPTKSFAVGPHQHLCLSCTSAMAFGQPLGQPVICSIA
jgi:NAD(P)-dependent dehydrogenase (short-subunit alcohol dehydrogenase family)